MNDVGGCLAGDKVGCQQFFSVGQAGISQNLIGYAVRKGFKVVGASDEIRK